MNSKQLQRALTILNSYLDEPESIMMSSNGRLLIEHPAPEEMHKTDEQELLDLGLTWDDEAGKWILYNFPWMKHV